MRKKIIRTENYHREFQVNNVVTKDVEEKRKMLVTRKATEKSLALQSNVYNEAFWESYNMVLENPLDKEIIEYFEKQIVEPVKRTKKGSKD